MCPLGLDSAGQFYASDVTATIALLSPKLSPVHLRARKGLYWMNAEVLHVAVSVWLVLAVLGGMGALVVVAWILLRSRA